MKGYLGLIIGVGDLAAAVEDAKSIYSVLVDPSKGAYEAGNIQLLIEAEPTKDNVINALDKLIEASVADPDGTIFIYYSGHANRYEDGNGGFDYYLKTAGAERSRKEETMLNGSIFTEKVNKLKSKKLLVMLDCCHAAGIKEDGLILKGDDEDDVDPDSVPAKGLLTQLENGKGKIFISSCDDHEKSAILPNAKNSLFTAVALETLSGLNYSSEEFIAAIDLIHDLLKKVPQEIKRFNHAQNPVINQVIDLRADYYVCRNGNYQVVAPPGDDTRSGRGKDPHNKIEKIKNITNAHDDHDQVSVSREDIKLIRNFFSDLNFGNIFSERQKINFFKELGGAGNLRTVWTYMSRNHIKITMPEDQAPGNFDVKDLVLSSLLFSDKLNFIKEYDHTI